MTKCIKFILAAMALLLVAMPVEARKSRAKRAKTSQVAVVKPKQLSTRSFSVAGVSFDMLQFEGGKVRINGKVATVDTFFLADEPVSQQLWLAVMGDNPSRDVNPAMPVQNVSWNRYQQFICGPKRLPPPGNIITRLLLLLKNDKEQPLPIHNNSKIT